MFGHSCIYLQVPALSPAEANTRLLHSIFHHSELLHVFGAQILGTVAYICRYQLYLLQSQTRDYCIQYFTTVYLGTVAYVWVLLLIFGYCCLYLGSVAYIWALLLMFGYCCIYLGTAAYNWALNWIYLQVPALSPAEPNTRLMATLHQILHHSILHLHSLQGTSLKSNV